MVPPVPRRVGGALPRRVPPGVVPAPGDGGGVLPPHPPAAVPAPRPPCLRQHTSLYPSASTDESPASGPGRISQNCKNHAFELFCWEKNREYQLKISAIFQQFSCNFNFGIFPAILPQFFQRPLTSTPPPPGYHFGTLTLGMTNFSNCL